MIAMSASTSRTSAGASLRLRGIERLAGRIDLDDARAARLRIGEEPRKARVVPLVDDARVVGVVGERRVELPDRARHRRGELGGAGARDERVVRRDARLAGVEELADRDLRRNGFERAVGVDDHRRLAAELQRHRRQVLRRRLRDEAADRRGAGEEQMVERQFHERLADRRVAGKHRQLVLGEGLAHDARHQLGGPAAPAPTA